MTFLKKFKFKTVYLSAESKSQNFNQNASWVFTLFVFACAASRWIAWWGRTSPTCLESCCRRQTTLETCGAVRYVLISTHMIPLSNADTMIQSRGWLIFGCCTSMTLEQVAPWHLHFLGKSIKKKKSSLKTCFYTFQPFDIFPLYLCNLFLFCPSDCWASLT